MDQMLETWRRLDMRRRIILAGATLLTALAVFSLAQVATRPGIALLYSGLDPAAAGEVVGALEQMNVAAEIRGDAIYVAEDARDRVRLALARDGLPRQGQAGYELLDRISGFSATTDMFNAAYWRAKEGELARTILASPGIRAARVHIAVPARRPFARDAAQVSASVTATVAGGVVTKAQATAIRYLVALAVPGLGPEQVAVIDSRAGVVLAPGNDAPLGDASGEAAAREAKLKAEIEGLLAARVGRDKARVSVTVETDREAETVTEKVIQPETRVLLHSDSEEVTESSAGSQGSVTVASNLPDGDAAADDRSNAERSETRERANYDYSEVNRQTVRQAGAIRRISVAVLVDGITTSAEDGTTAWEPRPADEIAALRELVIAAIGFDEARGDIVTVESMAFQADAAGGALVEASPWMRMVERNAMTLIQIAVLSAVVLILALTVIRPLLTRRLPDQAASLAPALAGDPAQQQLAPGGVSGSAPDGGAGTPLLSNGLPDNAALAGPGGGPGGSTSRAPGGGQLPGAPLPADGDTLRLAVAEQPNESVTTLRAWLAPETPEAGHQVPARTPGAGA